jgi:hypothetical protein
MIGHPDRHRCPNQKPVHRTPPPFRLFSTFNNLPFTRLAIGRLPSPASRFALRRTAPTKRRSHSGKEIHGGKEIH